MMKTSLNNVRADALDALQKMVADQDSSTRVEGGVSGPPSDTEDLGVEIVEDGLGKATHLWQSSAYGVHEAVVQGTVIVGIVGDFEHGMIRLSHLSDTTSCGLA